MHAEGGGQREDRAAQGIGRSIADTLARNGARVIYTDLDIDRVAEAARSSAPCNEGNLAFAMNVSDGPGIDATVAVFCVVVVFVTALLAGGHIDVVCEAGLKLHDWAALVPVVEGAGGTMCDWSGEPLHAGSDGHVLALGDPARLEDVLEAIHS